MFRIEIENYYPQKYNLNLSYFTKYNLEISYFKDTFGISKHWIFDDCIAIIFHNNGQKVNSFWQISILPILLYLRNQSAELKFAS